MEISGKIKERSTVIMAMLTLAVIGLTLVASTWQTMRHQSNAEEQHLYLTSRSILLALESSLRRGPIRIRADYLSPRTRELFESLENDGDVLFAGIIDHRGGKLLTSPLKQVESLEIPHEVIKGLFDQGQWHGKLVMGGYSIYFFGKQLEPPGPSFRLAHENPVAPVFLLVGLDTEKYLTMYKGFRKNILYQSIYILGAALVCWIFAFSYLARRDKAKKAEALESFQAALLDNLPDGLVTVDFDGIIRSVNPAAKIIMGKGDILGKPVAELQTQVANYLCDSLHAAVFNKNSTGGPEHISANISQTSGWQSVSYDDKSLEILGLPILQDSTTALLVIIRDRTQLKTLEQSLAEAEKLAMIGTLAAGVAHEVRNPLSALRGFSQYFVKKLSGKHPEEEYAKTMVTEADRLNRVITDLLFLAKPKRITPQMVDMTALTTDIKTLLSFDMEQKQTAITTRIDEPYIYADADALKQSLLNLLLNSFDAITPPAAPIIIATGRDGEHIWVEVADHGCGMTKEQATQAFEPFFTMKSRGTGLGLALVQRTMHDHGGSAKISSERGQGCTIRLSFPLPATLTHDSQEQERQD